MKKFSKKLVFLMAVATAALATAVTISFNSSETEFSAYCPPGEVPLCPFPDGMYSTFFPHPNDCHWFFHCSNGVPYCKECPAGLHWNVWLETCDYPFNAGCDKEGEGC